MVPAAIVQGTLDQLAGLLDEGDIIIDGGNSYYRDDIVRAKQLAQKNIHYVDCGTSGGVWGLERGYCLMIGGEPGPVAHLEPIFKTIAPGEASAPATPHRTRQGGTAPQGYLHCGPNGAGHFVKMVHNGVEYGMMAAIAEGLSIIAHADAGKKASTEVDAETTPLRDPEMYQYEIDVAEVAEVWRRGSVVGSWLVDLTADALALSPDLDDFAGPRVGLGRGSLDRRGGHRNGRPGCRHHRRPVRAFRVQGKRGFHRQDPLGHAVGVRRPRREEGLAMEHELVIVPDAAALAIRAASFVARAGGRRGGRPRPVHLRGERGQDPVGDVRRARP